MVIDCAIWLLHGWCHEKLLLSRSKFCHHTTRQQFTVSLSSKSQHMYVLRLQYLFTTQPHPHTLNTVTLTQHLFRLQHLSTTLNTPSTPTQHCHPDPTPTRVLKPMYNTITPPPHAQQCHPDPTPQAPTPVHNTNTPLHPPTHAQHRHPDPTPIQAPTPVHDTKHPFHPSSTMSPWPNTYSGPNTYVEHQHPPTQAQHCHPDPTPTQAPTPAHNTKHPLHPPTHAQHCQPDPTPTNAPTTPQNLRLHMTLTMIVWLGYFLRTSRTNWTKCSE